MSSPLSADARSTPELRSLCEIARFGRPQTHLRIISTGSCPYFQSIFQSAIQRWFFKIRRKIHLYVEALYGMERTVIPMAARAERESLSRSFNLDNLL